MATAQKIKFSIKDFVSKCFSELLSKSPTQSQALKTDTKAQTKVKDVKYTRIIVEVKVKKIILQCPKNNTNQVEKVLVEHILTNKELSKNF